MYGHVEALPRYIENRDNPVKLTLEMTNTLFTAEVIEVLVSIPNLQTLRLRVNKDQDGQRQFPATEVNKDQNGEPNKKLFVKLQVFEIACKSKLHVMFDVGAMEKLEHLKLHCLEDSEMQFSFVPLSEKGMQISGLEHPVSLKQVWLLGSFDDALKESVQQQLVKHPKKPALKLEVQPRSSQVRRRRRRC
jgi:hypothetical protein